MFQRMKRVIIPMLIYIDDYPVPSRTACYKSPGVFRAEAQI